MTELLDRCSAIVASLVGAEAARITPGASAAIALAVAATMTRVNGRYWEQLPDTTNLPNEAVIASSHLRNYKYASCARMSGAQLVAAGPEDSFDLAAMMDAVTPRTACILVPAHLLDGFSGTKRLAEVVAASHLNGVPVVVDAAYLSYPISLISQFAEAGVDLTCFSAKYFFGPNSGGFVSGSAELIEAVEGLDFTRFESGRFRTFGRPFKMSRYDVAATALALREWVQMDHRARWDSYAEQVALIAEALPLGAGLEIAPRLFTLDEQLLESDEVNCLVIRLAGGAAAAASIAKYLEDGNPIVAAVVEGDNLIVAVDALLPGQARFVGERVAEALSHELRRRT